MYIAVVDNDNEEDQKAYQTTLDDEFMADPNDLRRRINKDTPPKERADKPWVALPAIGTLSAKTTT